MKLKTSGLIVLLVLLSILIIFAMLCRLPFMKEGFVSFKQSEPQGSRVEIPQYTSSETPYKLYDSIYFDDLNGNLIEVDSSDYSTSGNVDMTGNTITNISVLPRDSVDVYTYEISSEDQILPDQPTELSSSYKSMIYRSEGENTDSYTVFYMPWDKKSYLHIVNTTPETPVSEQFYLFSDTSVVYSKDLTSTPVGASSYIQDVDSNNNSEVLEANYNSDAKVYQISKYVKLDKRNGNLLISSNQNSSIDVYKRNSENKITINVSDSTDERTFGNDEDFTSVDFSVRLLEDESGANTVLFVNQSFDSLVAIIGKDYQESLVLKNVKRFTPNGIDNGEGADRPSRNSGNDRSFADLLTRHLSNNNPDDTNLQTLINSLQNNNNQGPVSTGTELNLDNYILKTQVVPPVCPACPACPSCTVDGDSLCGNCGGNGGSGTLSDKGNSTVTGDEVAQNSEKSLTDTVSDTVKNVAGVASDAAKGTVSTAGDLTTGAIGTVGDIASGAVDVVGDVASSVISSGKKVVDAATDEEEVKKDEVNLMNSNTQILADVKADPYSYYGQIPHKKPSEYLPRTADFSSFGK